MLVLGHRGSRIPGPENTVRAVREALAAGADGFETDLRRTADRQLVCGHDAVLHGRPAVDTAGAELVAAGVPRLDDLMAARAGRGTAVLEIKNVPGEPDFDAPAEATAHLLVDWLTRRRSAAAVTGAGGGDLPYELQGLVISSFDWFAVEAVRAAVPGVPTAFLTAPGVAVQAGVAYAQEAGHAQLHAHVSAVLDVPGAVERVHDAGLALTVWTVVDVEQARRLADRGVDAVICDDPAAVVTALREPVRGASDRPATGRAGTS